MRSQIRPTGREVFFEENEIIVSKTDITGKITYANDVFLRVSAYTEEEILGKPHSIIRHPAMPRCVFQLLWDTIQSGEEIFAYVINLAKNGDHYWVFAHVTPTFDTSGNIVGYHSNRRVPDREAVELVTALYADLCALEQKASSKREAIEQATAALGSTLASKSVEYDEFIFSI
jgi:PAS domain S-box-containing protein